MSNRRSICFVTTTSATQHAFIVPLAQYLAQNGYRCTLVSSFDDSMGKYVSNQLSFVPVTMKRGVSACLFSAVYKLYKLFKKEKYDIVQYSTPNAALYASIAAKAAKIKHRIYAQWGIRYVGFSGIKRMFFQYIEKTICILSSRVQPDSLSNLEYAISEKLYKKDKASVIWNGSAKGVDLDKFNHNKKALYRNEILSQHPILDGKFVIGFVGRLDADKGVNELIATYKLLRNEFSDISLLFVGPTDKAHTIKRDLYDFFVNDQSILRINSTHYTDKYYSCMDIFVLPTYREGFGMTIIEASAMGIPVISTRIPGPLDAVINNETGFLVPTKDIVSLLDAIKKVYYDKNLSRRLGDNGIKYATEKFDSKIYMQKMLESKNSLFHT